MKDSQPISARELRKQVVLARIAMQRVEFQQELGALRERLSFPTMASQVMRSGRLTSALLAAGVALFKRFPGAKRLAERVGQRVPRSRVLLKMFGLAMALWPLIKFGREAASYLREQKRGRRWR